MSDHGETYIERVCGAVADVLERAAGGTKDRLAGYVANFDFWVAEAEQRVVEAVGVGSERAVDAAARRRERGFARRSEGGAAAGGGGDGEVSEAVREGGVDRGGDAGGGGAEDQLSDRVMTRAARTV